MNISQRTKFLLVSISFITIPFIAIAASRFPTPTIGDNITSHKATVHWTEKTKADFYRIRVLDSTCSTVVKIKDVDAGHSKKRLKKLSPNTTYCVRMRVFYVSGKKSKLSSPITFTTAADSTAGETTIARLDRFGVNFVQINNTDSDATAAATTPSAVDADLTALGVDVERQLTSAELLWSNVEKDQNVFEFDTADSVLKTTTRTPIVDLFNQQFASSTSPWDALTHGATQTTLTADAETYVATTVDRYKDYVKYWEIGNEMAHWELAYPDEFPVADQATWLKSVAQVIKEHDPDAVIVLPGLISITTDNVDDWLGGIVAAEGSDWFDVISYHYYERWQKFDAAHTALLNEMSTLGISDKKVWLTETGTSSDASNTSLTNYPNSTDEQAADVFRRALLSYASGDEMVIWHTYIGNDDSDNEYRYFGLINADLSKQPAYYTTKLLTDEVTQFTSITKESAASGVYEYAVTRPDDSVAYVAWDSSTGSLTVPSGVSEMTSVIPNDDGTFTWEAVTPGQSISLTDIPVLMK